MLGTREIGEEYRRMMKVLGVQVSISKTHVSPHFCEFAKRNLFFRTEVTPFPIAAVADCGGSVPSLVAVLSACGIKGLAPRSGIPGAVGEFLRETVYCRYGGIPSRSRRPDRKVRRNRRVSPPISKLKPDDYAA